MKLSPKAWHLPLLLALVSCAPAASDVRTEAVTYAAPYEAVFTAVVRFIAQDAGIPPYNPGGVNGYGRGPSTPWLVTASDRDAGLIVAEARSRAAGLVGSDAPPDVHQVNVLLIKTDRARTQVSVRGTPFTRVFWNRLTLALAAQFD